MRILAVFSVFTTLCSHCCATHITLDQYSPNQVILNIFKHTQITKHVFKNFNFIINILFLSHTSRTVSAQQSHVASDHYTGHHRFRKQTF